MAEEISNVLVKDRMKMFEPSVKGKIEPVFPFNQPTGAQKQRVKVVVQPSQRPQEESSHHISQPIQDWEKPRIFIETDCEGKLVVKKETAECLEKITEPIVVVSVVGLYRTGKSFLLNRLSGLGQGFELGRTVEPTTKGIWIWVVPHPKRDDCRLILIDTEGLGDIHKSSKDHDIWIYALGILLSSTFVYNSKGAIDKNAMDQLHFVTEVAEHIKVKSRTDDDTGIDEEGRNPGTSSSGGKYEELKDFFPSFVWSLRDCTLKLEINGQERTPDEYLEYALTDKAPDQGQDLTVSDKQTAKKMHPKDCIKDYFPKRRCFLFPIPVKDTDLMPKIDELGDSDFHKDFLKVANEFCDYIFSQSQVKTVFDNITTGRALARLATIYVESVRTGNAPCIQSAVESTAKIENEQAIKESVAIYTKKFTESVKFPTETMEGIFECHAKCSKEAFDFFLTKSVFDSEKVYYQQLAVQIEEIYAGFSKDNEIQSEEACRKLLENLYQEIAGNDYLFGGGYSKYEEDMQKLVDTYKETPHLEDVAARVLGEFMKGKEHLRRTILNADSKFIEAEKLEKDLKANKEALELVEKEMEESQKKIKLLEEEREQIKKEHVERLVAYDEKRFILVNPNLANENKGVMGKINKVVEDICAIPLRWIFNQ